MKTQETERLERAIRSATRKMGVYGCFEVTIGGTGRNMERVDYITYDTKGVWRCYEIKVTKSDFHSSAAKTFVGNYNYYVMPERLYTEVKEEIPEGIGVYVGGTCERKAKRRELSVLESLLKDSMIRSLYRDSDKLYQTGNEHLLDRLRREAKNSMQQARDSQREHSRLYCAVMNKYGIEEAKRLNRED